MSEPEIRYAFRAGDNPPPGYRPGELVRVVDDQPAGPATPDRPELEPVDWAAFWAAEPAGDDFLVEPLLPRGRVTVTYSVAKTGKSLLALDVAAKLATGRRILDQPAGPPVGVVYIDAEMGVIDLRERLEALGYDATTDLSRLAYFALPALPPIDTQAGGEALCALADEHDAELVVLDTTSRVLTGPENDSDTIRSYFRHSAAPLKAAGRTLWRLDHAGKDASLGQRGSSAKLDEPDVVWELAARDGGLRLRATHRRVAWVPERVDLVRLDDPLRHERAAGSWPAGTREAALLLDRLDVPRDEGRGRVRARLRAAGEAVGNEALAAAIRWRRDPDRSADRSKTASADSSVDR